ncbi:MAG: DUF1553 domain-containing protein [Pirellulaceae bacterium]
MSIAYLSRRSVLRSQIPLDRFVSARCSNPLWLFLFSCIVSVCTLEKTGAQDPPPIARWDFGAEETTSYRTVGEVQRDQPGPRPPRFPDLDPGNTAIRLEGRGARLEIADPGSHSPYDFAQGDSITLEAWVRITDLGDHEYHTVIGKGRTWQPGMSRDNHNWSMRIRRIDGKGHLDFLFATDPGQSDPTGPWHRWTSDAILSPDPQWHHVAIAYQFGNPESIRGWVDGKPVQGDWTMGGPTTLPPVVDDDAVWIGSSMNGSAGNSFIGLLDAIAIHRRLLTDQEIEDRYHVDDKIPTAVVRMPQIDAVPEGKITLQLIEAVGSHSRWPDAEEPLATPTLTTDRLPAFFLPRLPARFDAWGIRDAWKAPLLARLAADVELPAGPSAFLLRARGLSRLWVDGQLVAQCGPLTGSPSGEEPITPLPKAIAPGVRMPSYRQQEATGQLQRLEAGKVRVVLETMVGGKSFRPEPGELLVALQTAGSDAFQLLTPTEISIPLTDAGIEPLLASERSAWNSWDDDQRHTLSASQDHYWQQRHQSARQWLASRPSPIDPDQGDSQEIDRMIQHRIDALAVQQNESRSPPNPLASRAVSILQRHCVRCHGPQQVGGLDLQHRDGLLAGGDSGESAVDLEDRSSSPLLQRIAHTDPALRMPPTGSGLGEADRQVLQAWVAQGAPWTSEVVSPERLVATPLLDDAAFLRRATLDAIGLLPTEEELQQFLADPSDDKRFRAIDRLLADPRHADVWIPYWQDVLAENPTLINASLNSTGPFRWFLADALRDRKPIDRWVTELVMMRGNPHTGGSAGFGMAAENDAPMASKVQILAGAFLGMQMQCARCHDAPYHRTTQRDLFGLAAILDRKTSGVPASSRVPAAFFELPGRQPLIRATLRPDETVSPHWPLRQVTGLDDSPALDPLLTDPSDSRQRLALLLTSPENKRFAQVVANRVWRRLIGAGLMEPPDDWEGATPSHPELLQWLADRLVASGYQVEAIERLVMQSQFYQRTATDLPVPLDPLQRTFHAPQKRRMTAEQLVDSLHQATGKSIDSEELTFDPDGRRAADNRLSLGFPSRAWMMASLNNERDRPSLDLPRAGLVAEVMQAFGWEGARQMPRTDRPLDPDPLQPGILAQGHLVQHLTRATEGSPLAQMALDAPSPQALVDQLFRRCLTRSPSPDEAAPLVAALEEGFDNRTRAEELVQPAPIDELLPRVTWSNHLVPQATTIQMETQRRARRGPAADARLEPLWRERYEDVVWSLINASEFVWIP